MAKLSVREAAYRVGVTRQTLFKYIRQGKVSATVGHDGQKQIDVTELIRAFGELQPETVTSGDSSDRRPLSPTTANTATTTALQMELERLGAMLQFKEAELALAKERIDELKARELDAKHREREATEERMRMLGVIETQNRLLAAPQPVPPIKRAPRPARKTAAAPAKPRTTTKPKASVVVAVKQAKPKTPTAKAAVTMKKVKAPEPVKASKKEATAKKSATSAKASKRKTQHSRKAP